MHFDDLSGNLLPIYRPSPIRVDEVLWDAFPWFYHVLLRRIPVPSYNVLPLTAVPDAYEDMID